MKNLAYLRVSTAHQDVRSQRLAILEYAREQGFQIDRFLEAKASGRASRKHRRLDELMSELTAGDRLVVSELSRLGRSLGEVIELLDAISKASIKFRRHQGEHPLRGSTGPSDQGHDDAVRPLRRGRARTHLRTYPRGAGEGQGLGKKLGRPKGSLGTSRLDGREAEIRKLLDLGVSKSAVAKITGVSRPTLYNFLNTRGVSASAVQK